MKKGHWSYLLLADGSIWVSRAFWMADPEPEDPKLRYCEVCREAEVKRSRRRCRVCGRLFGDCCHGATHECIECFQEQERYRGLSDGEEAQDSYID